MRSTSRVIEDYRRRHPDERILPWVIPIVLYTGNRPDTSPRRLTHLCGGDGDEELRRQAMPFALDIGYVRVDLSQMDDHTIQTRLRDMAFAAIAHLALKHGGRDDFLDKLAPALHLLGEVLRQPGGREALRSLLFYMSHVVRDVSEQRLAEWIAPHLDAHDRETVMSEFKSYADVLREEGHLVGLQEGREEGREEGRRKEAMDVLRRQLRRKFGSLPDEMESKIEGATLSDLHAWLDRVVDADRLDDVVA